MRQNVNNDVILKSAYTKAIKTKQETRNNSPLKTIQLVADTSNPSQAVLYTAIFFKF